jgi:hypothetical protein
MAVAALTFFINHSPTRSVHGSCKLHIRLWLAHLCFYAIALVLTSLFFAFSYLSHRVCVSFLIN